VKKTERDLPSFMPKKRLTEAQRLQLLEDTKQRLRLELQARTQARVAELEIEVLENLERQLQLEALEHTRELECPRDQYCKTVYAYSKRQRRIPHRRKDKFVSYPVCG
jgi:hypothetical protein